MDTEEILNPIQVFREVFMFLFHNGRGSSELETFLKFLSKGFLVNVGFTFSGINDNNSWG